jgi:hypothetical protein
VRKFGRVVFVEERKTGGEWGPECLEVVRRVVGKRTGVDRECWRGGSKGEGIVVGERTTEDKEGVLGKQKGKVDCEQSRD